MNMFEGIAETLTKTFLDGVTDKFAYWFNPEFWTLIGYTGVGVAGAVIAAYFFPPLRSVAGAVVVGIAGMWFGYHKGQGKD